MRTFCPKRCRTGVGIALASIIFVSLLPAPPAEAASGPINQGGRLLPVDDQITNNVGTTANLYKRVDEYPSDDSNLVEVKSGNYGVHRVKFGAINSTSDAICATVRARTKGNTKGDVKITAYSDGDWVGTSGWRPLTAGWGNYVAAFDTSNRNLSGKPLSIKVQMRRSKTSGTVQYSQVFARLNCDDWSYAKVLGYGFGDGNYSPFSPGFGGSNAVSTMTFNAPNKDVARDFVEHGCAAGYKVIQKNASASLCDREANIVFNNASFPKLVIEKFRFPAASGPALPLTDGYKNFVENASDAERRAFLSAVIPTEGNWNSVRTNDGRRGFKIDDQAVFGDYDRQPGESSNVKACDRIHWRMTHFMTLLQGGDFPGNDTIGDPRGQCINDEGPGSRQEIQDVYIASGTQCRFNSVYGYEFAKLGRVPGAVEVTKNNWVQPPAC